MINQDIDHLQEDIAHLYVEGSDRKEESDIGTEQDDWTTLDALVMERDETDLVDINSKEDCPEMDKDTGVFQLAEEKRHVYEQAKMDTDVDMEQTRKWREFIEGGNTNQGLEGLDLLEVWIRLIGI
jgi:hypothetical protein